ncbi:hypothetical protein JNJ66_01885 [Candidatus Saccharibacteria bacterium]|nr:hypothetical protein [Candidatus Saccharibacteria bacterium]
MAYRNPTLTECRRTAARALYELPSQRLRWLVSDALQMGTADDLPVLGYPVTAICCGIVRKPARFREDEVCRPVVMLDVSVQRALLDRLPVFDEARVSLGLLCKYLNLLHPLGLGSWQLRGDIAVSLSMKGNSSVIADPSTRIIITSGGDFPVDEQRVPDDTYALAWGQPSA